jgi:ribosomal protein L17
MIKQLFEHEQITTTLAKAKRFVAGERLITLARRSGVPAKWRVHAGVLLRRLG